MQADKCNVTYQVHMHDVKNDFFAIGNNRAIGEVITSSKSFSHFANSLTYKLQQLNKLDHKADINQLGLTHLSISLHRQISPIGRFGATMK